MGNVALPAPLCESVTARPPPGAGSLDETVTVVLTPAMSVVVGAVRTSATCCFTVSTVFVETVWLLPSITVVKLKLAPIVLVPAARPFTKPAALIVAAAVLELVQVTRVLKSWLVPSVIAPLAMNCSVSLV